MHVGFVGPFDEIGGAARGSAPVAQIPTVAFTQAALQQA